MAMYTINHCTQAFLSVKKLDKFIIFFILILTTLLFMWKYEQFSENLLKRSLKSVYNENLGNTIKNIPGQNNYDLSSFMVVTEPKPWFFKNGTTYPEPAKISQKTGIRDAKLLPEEDPGNDRILNQLMFVPPNYNSIVKSKKVKIILAYYDSLFWWKPKLDGNIFQKLKCPVDTCRITTNKSEIEIADLVFFYNGYEPVKYKRPSKQIYAIYYYEPPHKGDLIKYPDVFNWTITYRMDSTIPAPYNKFVYYDSRTKQREQNRNYAANKTKKIAWYVSNCEAKNDRLNYARELKKYIQVDIYGKCGDMKCPYMETNRCDHRLAKEYKFYLAFENSNCKDYISEKFFRNALGHNVIPIAMGAPPEDYEKYAPFRSYIHVEHFESPKELAEYLHILDKNDDFYNSYFKWKGTGEFLGGGPKTFCRLCALLHDEHATSIGHWYNNINDWWRGPEICTNGYWRDFNINNSKMTFWYKKRQQT